MRGSPLLQALLLAVALALAGIPIWSLTRPHDHAEPVRAPASEPGTSVREMTITSTADAEVELDFSGSTIWRGHPAAQHFETTLSLPPDAELVARVRWTKPGTNAVRLQFSQDGDQQADVTLWGDGEATDVVPVPPRSSTP
jgi:hypothetical protein